MRDNRAHQIYHLHTAALNKFHERLVMKSIIRGFDVQPKGVRHALEKGDAIPRRGGEHLHLKRTSNDN
jgi:hypothetical protein